MTQSEDLVLVKHSLQGDMNAFSVLIDRYKYMVYTLACRILRNKEDAEEVAQDSFVKAFKGSRSYKGDSKFSTWLYKITYHQSLDRLKKNKRQMETVELSLHKAVNISELDGILEAMELKERNGVIKEAISQLSEEDAVIISLYYYQDYTIREIAEIVSLTPQVVKIRLFRSRKQLAGLLQNKLSFEKITADGNR